MSLVLRKSLFGVSYQLRHKPGCAVTDDGLYIYSENKVADQLSGYRKADLRLCFSHMLKSGFLRIRLKYCLFLVCYQFMIGLSKIFCILKS